MDALSVPIRREDDATAARIAARHLAEALGLGHQGCFYLMIAVSELATNLFFHTVRGGILHIIPITREQAGRPCLGIEVVAEDDGPGIPDIEAAMTDGFSTNGSLGCGLPGVRRLMDEFDIVSAPGSGTRVTARIWKKA